MSSGIRTYGNTTTSRRGTTGRRSGMLKVSVSRVNSTGPGAWGLGPGGNTTHFAGPYVLEKKYVAGRQSVRRRISIGVPQAPSPGPQAQLLCLFLLPLGSDLEHGWRTVHDARLGHAYLDHVVATREIEHHVQQDLLEDCAQSTSAGASLQSLRRDGSKRRLLERDPDRLQLEQLLVLLGERVLRLLQDPHERFFIERFERHHDRETADQFGNESVAQEVVRLDFGEWILGHQLRLAVLHILAAEADLFPAHARLDDLVQSVERAAADEQDVLGVDLDVFLLRVLAASLRRNRSNGSLEDLKECLLDAFAGYVARDARVFGLPRDLVEFVDVDDSALALGDIEVTGLQQPDEDVLDVFADVARFSERGRVGDGEGNVQDAGQRLREKSLADARRAQQQDVALVELDVVVARRTRIDPLVVIVDRDRECLLRVFLPDDVLVEDVLDLGGRRDLGDRLSDFLFLVFRQDLVTQRDALVADVNRGPGDELPHRVLGFSAERTTQVFVVRHGRCQRKAIRKRLAGGTEVDD